MRRITLLLGFSAVLFAQDAWRREVMSLPERPGPGVTRQDIERLEYNARMAYPYFATLTPRDYENNRAVVRRMATYLTTVDFMNRDPGMRAILNRAYVSVAGLTWMMPYGYGYGRGTAPAPEPQRAAAPAGPPSEPRFSTQAPDIEKVDPADRATATDLSERYEMAAAKAATAWKSADVIRRSLQSNGMTLNALTETSLARIQLYFDLATDALKSRDWVEAKTNIDRADYETEKVRKTVGR